MTKVHIRCKAPTTHYDSYDAPGILCEMLPSLADVEVLIDGVPLEGVTEISWSCREGEVPFVTFKVAGATIDADAMAAAVPVGSRSDDPFLCEHANENPAVCRCRADCYCQTRTCKNRARLPACAYCGSRDHKTDAHIGWG